MSKVLLTDCDGVLLNWLDTFCDYLSVDRETFYVLDIHNREDLNEEIKSFNESARCGFLPPIEGAIEGIKTIKNLGYEIHVITSFGGSSYAARLRFDNLRRHFGNAFTSINILSLRSNKRDYLEDKYPNKNHFFIEDSPENARIGAALGLRPILLRQEYNENSEMPDEVIRADSWYDIVKSL